MHGKETDIPPEGYSTSQMWSSYSLVRSKIQKIDFFFVYHQ